MPVTAAIEGARRSKRSRPHRILNRLLNPPDAVLSDPNWFPHHVDARSGAIRFLYLTRDAHRAAAFLSDENLKSAERRVDVAFADTAGAGSPGTGPVHFVFHSAFCGSTLLARALDIPGRAMGLKEPAILNDVAQARRSGLGQPRLGALLERALTLLARPFSAGESTVIKPGNVANCLIEPCLDLRPRARALLMYSPLPTFLRSIAKQGLWGRSWSRQLFQVLRPESKIDPGYSDTEIFRQTDLQIAALAWLMHQAQFADALRRYGKERVRTLEGDVAIARGAEVLFAAARFFGFELTATEAAGIASGPVFSENSKSHQPGFDQGVRAREHAKVDAAHGEEIGMVLRWADAVALHCGVPLALEAPLLG